ncbi:MAG TPA: hypothetical protein VG841_08640 [Caulobacterales bacterium]|nr:hypothetical protein [Caulobacterales bacterium]
MAEQTGKVPILGSIAAAARTFVTNWRIAATAGVVGAVLSALFSMLSFSAPALGLVWSVLSAVVSAFVYAALIGGALDGSKDLSQRVAQEGWRVLGAMAVVGFFLFIVFVVVAIADGFILAFAAADYLPQLQEAGKDTTRVYAIMQRFAMEKPAVPLFVFLLNAAIWMTLTSRLYAAAPASYDSRRILTFETWKWTKGNMLRILAARLLLLLPIYIVVFALGAVLLRLLTPNIFDAEALSAAEHAQPALFAIISVVSEFVQFALYFALEAALSAHIYKLVRPQAQHAGVFS